VLCFEFVDPCHLQLSCSRTFQTLLFITKTPDTMPKAAAKEKAPAKSKKAPAKEKKEKAAKDPNAPKRPMGAYFLFSGDMRAKVKADNPDMKVTEIAKHIGELWKNISEKEKEKYQKKADEAKAAYEKEVEKYKASGGGGGAAKAKPAAKKATKKAKEPEPEEDEDEASGGDDGDEDEEDE